MPSIPVLREPTNTSGELLLVRIAVEPHLLEELLEALASAPFPINPQILHRSQLTKVEFPAYSSQLQNVRKLVEATGLSPNGVTFIPMMVTIGSEDQLEPVTSFPQEIPAAAFPLPPQVLP